MDRAEIISQFGKLTLIDKKAPPKNESGRIFYLNPAHIAPNPAQPRKKFDDEAIIRLADSIRQYGILQPLSVRRLTYDKDKAYLTDTEDTGDGIRPVYEIIAGERRMRAAKLLGMTEIPCIIIEADDRLSAELAIIENIQRENLNIFEQAGAIAALIDIYDLTQEQVARQLSASQSYVANKLRILRLTAAERAVILDNGLTERHARALLKIDDGELRIKTLEHIASRGLNVAASEAFIEKILTEDRAERARGKRKIIIKDIRIFYNTIEHAVDVVRQAGIDIIADRREVGDGVEFVIKIAKLYNTENHKAEDERSLA
ncbi:MAG: ParB/RepB/Spo0J family partition protein [Eubacteriales bacterium]|nr:ParB/RepB/Spo0J family partition protein [Eubacteriales bacterium]